MVSIQNSITDVPNGVEIVVNPYGNKYSSSRKGIMIEGEWSKAISDFIEKESIEALFLNYARGWKGKDFSFLSELNSIKELDMIVAKAENLDSISGMYNLEEVNLACHTNSEIDFTKLKKLRKCYVNWWTGASSILDCVSLESLYLDEVKIKGLSKIGLLKNLTSLTIANSTVDSIEWVSKLPQLTKLSLLNCKQVKDFSAIEACVNLKELTIDGSKKLMDIDFLKNLKGLEFINLSSNGEIATLAPLSCLENLKALAFAGNTIIKDGDLSVLVELPKLSMLMFQGRRHYTHKLIKKWDWENFNTPDTLLKSR